LQRQAGATFLKLFGAGTLGSRAAGRIPLRPGVHAKAPARYLSPSPRRPSPPPESWIVDGLVDEVKFVDRGGVHGFVWPQMVGEWLALTEPERLLGMEAIASAGRS